jgi:hypothetical protein
MVEGFGEVVAALEAAARRRFVRWDAALWAEVLRGPAARLARAVGDEEGALVEGYLRLAAEGIGLGYLVPSASGVENFFTLAWMQLLPTQLAALPSGSARATAVAQCWNLGENLEGAAAWLKRLFQRRARELRSLGELPALAERIGRVASEAPKTAGTRLVWIALAEEERRFLPGALHFVAPTVVCVHDRERTDPSGAPLTLGVWLDEAPLVLGPMACEEEVAATTAGDWAAVRKGDPRVSEIGWEARNEWRTVASLVTSQRVIALV